MISIIFLFSQKISDLNIKLANLATKAELKAEYDKILKLQQLDLSSFHDKSHFEDDGTQNYLAFQPTYFKTVARSNKITIWKSKGLSGESFKPPLTSDNSFTYIILIMVKYE